MIFDKFGNGLVLYTILSPTFMDIYDDNDDHNDNTKREGKVLFIEGNKYWLR